MTVMLSYASRKCATISWTLAEHLRTSTYWHHTRMLVYASWTCQEVLYTCPLSIKKFCLYVFSCQEVWLTRPLSVKKFCLLVFYLPRSFVYVFTHEVLFTCLTCHAVLITNMLSVKIFFCKPLPVKKFCLRLLPVKFRVHVLPVKKSYLHLIPVKMFYLQLLPVKKEVLLTSLSGVDRFCFEIFYLSRIYIYIC